MRNGWILTLAMGVIVVSAYGQQADSIRQRIDSLSRANAPRYDSVSGRINNRIDSVQGRINAILNPDFNKLGRATTRSLSDKLARKRTKADTLRAKQQLDSSRLALHHKMDSLGKLNLSTDHLSKKLDSLNQMGPGQYLNQMDIRRQEAQNRINGKLDLMNREGGGGTNLPGRADLPGVNAQLNVPGNEGLRTDNPLGNIENPLKEELKPAAELQGRINEWKEAPQEQINKMKSAEGVQSAQQKLGEVNQLTDKAQAYSADVKNIAEGNFQEVKELPKGIEQQVGKLSEVQELQKQKSELGKMQSMVVKGNDPEAIKKMAEEQAKQQAVVYAKNHFAGKEAVLQQAMDKITKLKTKYASLDSLANLPRFKPSAMKGKPFVERLVPSVVFQIQKSTNVWLDYGLLVGYRLNGRWTMGLGWNERIGIQRKLTLIADDRIFGPRSYTDVMIWRGFALRLEAERMRTKVNTDLVNFADAAGNAWVWSGFAGLRKEYRFSKSVKGNFLCLYNLYDDHDSSPYLDRFNVRFGFDFQLYKRGEK